MKKLFIMVLSIMSAFNLLYILALYDSFIREYMLDGFEYWGFPQWGWMYESPERYFYSNIFLLIFLSSLWFLGDRFQKDYEYKRAFVCMGWVFLSFLAFTYIPFYNWEEKAASLSFEQKLLGIKVPKGEWHVYPDDVESYADENIWEKFKNLMGRGNWPGGYPIWGEYRGWMRPSFEISEEDAKGVVVHSGSKGSSPWGLYIRDDIDIMLESVRRSKVPMDINITHLVN